MELWVIIQRGGTPTLLFVRVANTGLMEKRVKRVMKE
jgi:hypothetical protein